MSREWKPGDVAQYDGTFPGRLIKSTDEGWVDADRQYRDPAETFLRPLVVIDPEDREEVERLAAKIHEGNVEWLQNMLRELADPTPPKPAEPTGQGAVVEDDEGRRWLRRVEGGRNPWMFYDKNNRETRAREWAEIAAVRVLSEGVQP